MTINKNNMKNKAASEIVLFTNPSFLKYNLTENKYNPTDITSILTPHVPKAG